MSGRVVEKNMQNIFSIAVAQAGAITDAPKVMSILSNVLQFLLSIAGILGIIGLVIAGVLYLTAAGDTGRIALAKKAAIASVIGISIVLGTLVTVNQITVFFD